MIKTSKYKYKTKNSKIKRQKYISKHNICKLQKKQLKEFKALPQVS